ncbi:hypothetical protein [Legionella cherrii]|uniref:Uncharacterized protein n=1 Tax=Legionella cherrii TaxID=28084 RepID=A0ABY6T6Q0_9GAMM|nr:hypothetical protein [Legionella cherrii]VEB37165.1 Uncharacterised protein [Legionella cherrii]
MSIFINFTNLNQDLIKNNIVLGGDEIMGFSEIFKENLRKEQRLKGFDKPSFYEVLELLDKNKKICEEKGYSPDSKEALDLMKFNIFVKEMAQLKSISRFEMWNVTVTPPNSTKGETNFSYQFCSAPPDCTRIFFSYDVKGEPQLKIADPCVVLNPDLESVHAFYGDKENTLVKQKNITLGSTIKSLNEMHIQRIGLLGFARNFPDHLEEKEVTQKGPEERKTKLMYQQRASYAARAIDGVIEELENQKLAFTTVNGGWSGQKQTPREVGMTYMGHLYGLIHDHDTHSGGGFFPPITVMPEGGSTDAVTMHSRTKHFLLSDSDPVKTEESHGSRTQFIVENVDWGQDSPYLASMCTSMVVIEPAGRWTQIEMLNGLERGIPVVIIASPENYDEKWLPDNTVDKLYEGLTKGEKYINIPFPTSQDPKAVVRAYRDPADAAKWIAWRYEADHFHDKESTDFLKNETNQKAMLNNLKKLDKAASLDDVVKFILDGTEASQKVTKNLRQRIEGMEIGAAIKSIQSLLSPDLEVGSTKKSVFTSGVPFFRCGTQAHILSEEQNIKEVDVAHTWKNPLSTTQ